MLRTSVGTPWVSNTLKQILFVYCTNEILRVTEIMIKKKKKRQSPRITPPQQNQLFPWPRVPCQPLARRMCNFSSSTHSSLSLQNRQRKGGRDRSPSALLRIMAILNGSMGSINLQDSASREPGRGASRTLLTYSFLISFCRPLWEHSREPS